MVWISMSERDLKWVEVLSDVQTGHRTMASAEAILAVSKRQAFLLLAQYEAEGITTDLKDEDELSNSTPSIDHNAEESPLTH